MRIITHGCDECGTIVAANELENRRVMKCPGLDCDNVLRFEALTEDEQEYFLAHRKEYQI